MEKTLKWKIEIDDSQAQAAVKRLDDQVAKEQRSIRAKSEIIERLGKQAQTLAASQRLLLSSLAVDAENKSRKEAAGLALKLAILNKVGEAQKKLTTVKGLKEPDYEKALAGIAEMGNISLGVMDEHITRYHEFQEAQKKLTTVKGLKEPDYEKALAGIAEMGNISLGVMDEHITRYHEFQEAQKKLNEELAKEAREREKIEKAQSASKARYDKEKQRGAETIAKNLPLAAAPIFQPTSFWANAIAVNRIQAMLQTQQGKGFLSATGLSAGAVTTGAVAAMVALGLAIKGLQAALNKAREAIDFSAKIYSKTVMSGLGTRATVGRNLIGGILGVDEKEIFQFGAAMQYIQPRIRTATDVLTKNATALANISVDFKILESNMLAAGSALATALAPSIRTVIVMMTDLADVFLKFSDIISTVIKKLVDGVLRLAMNFVFPGAGDLAMAAVNIWKSNAARRAGAMSSLPEAAGFMKQMPASAWEKMGLVIGGSGVNHAAETAKNTKKTANTLDKILSAIVNGENQGSPILSPVYNHQ